MKIINIDWRNFLAGFSKSNYVNDKGFSPSSLGFETNRQANEGLLLPGRTLTSSSTNIADNVVATCMYYSNSTLKYYSIGDGKKIYETAVEAGTHTLKATLSGGSFSSNSDIIVYQGALYITSDHSTTANIVKSDFSFTGGDPDEDWWTAVAGGNVLTTGVPHKMFKFNDTLYIANGNKLCSWDGTNHDDAALTLPTGWIITDTEIINNRIYITASFLRNYYTSNMPVKIFVWDGFTADWIGEIPLNIPNVATINEVNGRIIVTGGRSLFEFTGNGLRHIAYLTETPQNWKQATVFDGKLYFRSYQAIKCYDPKYDSVTAPIYVGADSGNINCLIIGYLDYIDIFSAVNTFYRASVNTNGSAFYSNFYHFASPVIIRRIDIIFAGALGTNCNYQLDILNETGNGVYENAAITYAAEGAITKKVDRNMNGLQVDGFQIYLLFNHAANKGVRAIRIYYDESERSTTK